MADYYSILGVPKTATQAQIKEAYLRLARENHPDRFQDPGKRTRAEETIQAINESYNHLRDEKLRRQYDETLSRVVLPPHEQAERYYRNGIMREELTEYTEALKFFYEAMQLEPANALYMGAAARVMSMDRTQVRQAAELYNKAIALDPKRKELYLELGELLQRAGLPTRARRVFEAGLQQHPHDPELQQQLSEATAAADRARRK
ncbi:MAG: DnaJ domain-containing protein [Vicinamibacteria bacterium]